jgi:hypothetical protein
MTTLEAANPPVISKTTHHESAALASPPSQPSRRAIIAGRIVSGFISVLLTLDVGIKLLRVPEAVSGTQDLGYPASSLLTIGLAGLLCLITYLVPRTAILGAVLWTGYLGGAIATHVRVENPLFSHVLFPIYVAVFIWGGLWLRDARVRALLSFR